MPGSPQALATSDGTCCSGLGVAIYDNGVRRSNTSRGSAYAIGPLAFGATPSVLYGYDSYSSGFELVKFNVDANGVTGISTTNNLLTGYINGLKFSDGLLYHASGRVADPETKQLAGTFQNVSGNSAFTVDAANGRIFFLYLSGTGATVSAYDINTFLPLGSITLPGVTGNPVRLVRWGTNGLAFNTRAGGPSDTSASHVYLVQSALVSPNGTVPTGVQFATDKYNVPEASAAIALSVTRNGDVSGSTTVNYATSDGTATAGSDYTATSGTLTFAPGELVKTISVPLLNDSVYEGPNQTFNVALSAPSGGAVLGSPSTAVVTIIDDESVPFMLITNSVAVNEGNSGNTQATFNVTLSNATLATVTVNYATANGSASAGSDYVATSGTLTFPPGSTLQTINVVVIGDTVDEPDETFSLTLTNATNVSSFPPTPATATIINDDGPPKLQFTSTNYLVGEEAGRAVVTVTRFGRALDPVSVDFLTSDGSAVQTRDYTIAAGTLQFAAGETTRTFSVLITDDVYQENSEFLNLTLSNPTGTGAALGFPNSSRVTIIDNDAIPQSFNAIDDPQMFVRQHYYDFLSRLPDQAGLNYWSGQITQCGVDPLCIQTKRVGVSNAFFYELEYQQTGSYVYRLYRAAFGNNQPFLNPVPSAQYPNEEKKLPAYAVFAPDRARVKGGAALAQTQLDLASLFGQRAAFVTKYPATLDGPGFVDAMLATIRDDTGADLTSQRAALITLFNQGGRAAVVYRLADDDAGGNPINNRVFIDAEYNRAFVVTQYFGYLRRNPDISGFMFWLGQVNSAALRDVAKQHAMVCSFITSSEYQLRFGAFVTHSNSECP